MTQAPNQPSKQERKRLWLQDTKDKLFLKDVEETEAAFQTADAESASGIG